MAWPTVSDGKGLAVAGQRDAGQPSGLAGQAVGPCMRCRGRCVASRLASPLPLAAPAPRAATFLSWECGPDDGSYYALVDTDEGVQCEVGGRLVRRPQAGRGSSDRRPRWQRGSSRDASLAPMPPPSPLLLAVRYLRRRHRQAAVVSYLCGSQPALFCCRRQGTQPAMPPQTLLARPGAAVLCACRQYSLEACPTADELVREVMLLE